jgi:Protein of unknown function (DUF3048) N-terminal domain/Protein of unknown function (DUF3048) C-terminal domain
MVLPFSTLDGHLAHVKAQNKNQPNNSLNAPKLPPHPRTVFAIVGTIVILVLVAGGVFAYQKLHPKPAPVAAKPAPTPAPTPAPVVTPPAPTTKASPLTGVQLAPATADRPVAAVVIENHTDARPQSGLGDAGVVYEALAEGGITRYLAFFLENRPATLGPVRSLRTYFVDWAREYNAPVAHAGGNADALDLIAPTGMRDMNQFTYGASFWRSTDRYAPHNLYTSSDLLDALERKLGYANPATFTPTPRKSDVTAAPTHPTIKIPYSYASYQVEYHFDAACDCYARFLGGAPHIDRNSGHQINVKNVVVLYTNTSYGYTRIGEQTVVMGTVGSGKALVFLDGQATVATWSKPSRAARTVVSDSSGKEIPLNVGNTWYSVVPVGKVVTY